MEIANYSTSSLILELSLWKIQNLFLALALTVPTDTLHQIYCWDNLWGRYQPRWSWMIFPVSHCSYNMEAALRRERCHYSTWCIWYCRSTICITVTMNPMKGARLPWLNIQAHTAAVSPQIYRQGSWLPLHLSTVSRRMFLAAPVSHFLTRRSEVPHWLQHHKHEPSWYFLARKNLLW